MLYIVATPIGNLEDLSVRAQRILSEVDIIAAEDTRHTQRLLMAINVETPLLSLHDHNEPQRLKKIIDMLQAGKDVALVSDAGTPTISDPGFKLVRAVRAAGLEVSPVPGACAAIAALSASGLPTDRFCFEGFLPTKAGAREKRLQGLANEQRTLIFYLSPHRLEKELKALADALGADREATLTRELTKLHESHYHGALSEILKQSASDEHINKGELTLVIAGTAANSEIDAQVKKLAIQLRTKLSTKDTVELVASITGAKKNTIKELLK